MLRFLFDTDHLTLYQNRHPQLRQRMVLQPPDAVGISAVTVEESLRGRLAALSQADSGPRRIVRYRLLLETLDLLISFPLVPYDQASENHFQHLRSMRLRVGTQDLKIAAIALANNVVLLTRNRRDFAQIPGLVLADWSV
ncbi:MAG TPA: type II toxin-antitoxin system VapC family toxin [Gemmataceae bacterium]|nr:type II toxin-antitoxin system VapC family toxin [Gemmataceae bacterium]